MSLLYVMEDGASAEIAVENPHGVSRGVAYATLDGSTLPDGPTRVPLMDDGGAHRVRVILGPGR